jgi:hypothetical protein
MYDDNLLDGPGAVVPAAGSYAGLLAESIALYSPDIHWIVPRRGLALVGRQEVSAHLLREASAMRSPELTVLRRRVAGHQQVEEYSVRFEYSGQGLTGLSFAAGDRVELERVRVLDFTHGQVVAETSIETWSRLGHSGMALRDTLNGSSDR